LARVRVSARASSDLAEIKAFSIDRFGPHVAREYLDSFERAFLLLAERPRIGRLHDEVEPAIRSFANGSHRIYYDIDGNVVQIRRVLHKATDVKRWLRDPN
jgi:toxin ParE1/3/4